MIYSNGGALSPELLALSDRLKAQRDAEASPGPFTSVKEYPRDGTTYDSVTIHDGTGGYEITAERGGYPVVEYDRDRFRLERDPESTEQRERFRIVPKEQGR